MGTRKNNKPDLPSLLTAREFGYLIGRSRLWVIEACREGRIPAAQFVNNWVWIIPEDALIIPRYLEDFPTELLDVELPEEFVLWGKRVEIPKPMPGKNHFKPDSIKVNLYELPNLRRVRERKEYTQRGLASAAHVDQASLSRVETGVQKCRYSFARRLCDTLNVDITELMHRELE